MSAHPSRPEWQLVGAAAFPAAAGLLPFVKSPWRSALIIVAAISLAFPLDQANAQTPDPGPRGGSPGAGGTLRGLDPTAAAFFAAAKSRFQGIDTVTGRADGLGPKFNLNSCSGCHAQPAVGGSSPALNPQIAVASLDGANNTIPPFISSTGPVRVARFIQYSDGSPDGHVHELFTIAGRADASGCAMAQPNFAAAIAANNIIFRIPTPMFGLGLVEATPDLNLKASFNASAKHRSELGIGGHFNIDANDGTISRFGWKAQNKSLLMFAGEAYNVEIGVTNELFPNKINSAASCAFNATPEDATNLLRPVKTASPASDYSSDIVNFAAFARLSAPPVAQRLNTSTSQGEQIFQQIGCAACHTMQQMTGRSSQAAALNQVSYAPFSDFAVHHMGEGLADGISQGTAAGDEFRTAPLWGLGQRLFFLHDGRTNDLNQAILAHASSGSEANMVVATFAHLPAAAVATLLLFLRAL